MAIPAYDALMPPVLRLSAERVWSMRELIKRLSDELGLSEAEREQTLPSGGTTIIASRAHWAKTYLKQAGLVTQPKRGLVEISQQGRVVLASGVSQLDTKFLMRFPEFVEFVSRTRPTTSPEVPSGSAPRISEQVEEPPTQTPEEQIASAASALDAALRDAFLARVLEGSPAFFESLIVDLVVAMGYGGSRADAGERLGRSGDGGVDGVIREDQLGLDRIYLQAKRYQPGNAVGSEAVNSFLGALIGQGAQKGILITTASFSKQARVAADRPSQLRLVLIDGEELTRLMVRFGVGVRVARTVEIKRVDLDYFDVIDPE